jgi:hypothetical protein
MSYYGPEQPSDPWEQGDPQVGYDAYGDPDPYGQGYQQADVLASPERSGGSTALVAVLVTVLVIVLCGGGTGALYLLGAKDRTPGGSATTPPPTHTSQAAATGSPSPNYDPTSIIKNQCVTNDGDQENPKLRVVGCAPGTLVVLARFDGTTDVTKCKAVPGASFNYFYDTTPDTLDFVLCFKQQ